MIVTGRPYTTAARAERDGRMVCSAVLLSVQGAPGRLGVEVVQDMTAWFYGDLNPTFEVELELLADAARGAMDPPELDGVDLIVQAPGGELRLEGCRLGLPVRIAGPASTLQYRLAHAPAESARLRLVA